MLLLLFLYILSLLSFNVEGVDKTRVYNAKARRIQGTNDMNIMVIQVGLTNFDESGQEITIAPPPLTVPNQIAHKVTWTPELGVIIKKDDTTKSEEFEEPIEIKRDNTTKVLPDFISHYLSRAGTPDPEIESKKFIATILALTVGLIFLLILAYTVSVLIHKRKKKKLILRRQQSNMESMNLMRNRPKAELPYDMQNTMRNTSINDVFDHEYENMDDIDEQSSVEMLRRPPPVPPRLNRQRPKLYMVLDQPVSILLEKDQRNVPIRPIPSRIRNEDFSLFMEQQNNNDRIRRESV